MRWSLVLLAACATAVPAEDDTDTDDTDDTDVSGPVEVTEASFPCITDMAPVRRYRVASLTGRLDEALAVADDPEGKVFPVGTLLQLVPAEAMVKREAGFAPETDDWEFFFLGVSESGTEILTRGPDAKNAFGGNCADCHAAAAERYDWVCESGHGCVDLPLSGEAIADIQDNDPRCE